MNLMLLYYTRGAFVTVNSVEIDYGSDNTISAGETIDVTVELENLGNDSSH